MNGIIAGSTMRLQDRRAIVVGAIIVVAALGFARVVRPAMDQLAQQRQTLTEQSALLAREQAVLAMAPTWPQATHDVQKILSGENARLFSGDSVAATADLSAFVAGLAAGTGVRLTTMEGRPPHTASAVTRLSVDVRGEGSWRQVLGFIHALESSVRLVDVASVRIERGARGGPLGGDLVTMSATIAGYSRGTR